MRQIFLQVFITVLVGIVFFPDIVAANCHQEIIDASKDSAPVHPEDHILDAPYTDILQAWMRPAQDYPAVEFGVITREPFPYPSNQNYNLFFFIDLDRDSTNNAPSGTRAGSDTAFSLLWGGESQQWKTVIWSFDSQTGEWAHDVNSSVLFAPIENGFIIHVPYSILPEGTQVPFRAAVAASEGDSSAIDTAPDGEGSMADCQDGEQVTITPVPETIQEDEGGGETPSDDGHGMNDGIAEESPSDLGGDILQGGAESITPKIPGGSPSLFIIFGIIVLMGGIGMAVGRTKGGKKNGGKKSGTKKGGKEEPASALGEEAPAMASEKITCDCPSCSLYIAVGSSRDRAIGSAKNLGEAMKRDTAKGGNKCCLKVMHFNYISMKSGRYVTVESSGKTKWHKFSKREKGVVEDGHKQICIWDEVMIVMHGENKEKVKTVIGNITALIPKAPIKRLVLYYCGGGATLPKAEFNALASELGRRLKQIPEECRPDHMELLIAPVIEFGDEPTYTVLSINKDGLLSFEGKMYTYYADENGNVTPKGNQRPRGGQLIGCVELGKLENNPESTALTYMFHWRRICKLKLSEIRKYREEIRKANMKDKKGNRIEPPLCPKELLANKVENTLKKYGIDPYSEKELDELMEKPKREVKKRVKARIKANRK